MAEEQTNGATAGPGPEGIPPEQKRIEELEAQVKEKESKYLYLYADFENFKKRAVKERSDLLRYGWEPLAHELLETLDNLERAIAHLPATTDKQVASGLGLVLNQFRSTLTKQGLQEIPAKGKPFDPNFHEAVAHEPSDQAEGVVTQEHHRGYTLHGRLLRPARVTVSAGQAAK